MKILVSSTLPERQSKASLHSLMLFGIRLPILLPARALDKRRNIGVCGLVAVAALTSFHTANGQNTIFSESLGVPSGNTSITAYATGTAPATFQNKSTLTFDSGDQIAAADLRATSVSNNAGSSAGGNVFFTSTAGARGFSIGGISASGFTGLQLSYGYRKESGTAHATFSVDYWNGASWVTVANTSSDLFNETTNLAATWYPAKTLNLPAGAQIGGLKIRFVKTGNLSIRVDDIKLTGIAGPGVDTTPPQVTLRSPANGTSAIAIQTDVVGTFDEPVQAGTGTILLQKTAGSVTVPAAITITGSSVTLNPTADLEYSTAYNVVIPSGAITDLSGNAFTGIPENGAWSFTTAAEDLTSPVLVSTNPINGATNISPPTTLSVTFNEPIQFPNTNAAITVRKLDGTPVVIYSSDADISISGAVATLTIPAATPLDFGQSYYVEFEGGAFEDFSGNLTAPILGNTTFAFSTVDVPPFTGTPYTQNFASYTSAATLPAGWSFTGASNFISAYQGDWGTVTTDPLNPNATLGGFKGNQMVFGYSHSSITNTSVTPLRQTLTLRNSTAAPITALTVLYKGRAAVLANTRLPAYTVTVGGVVMPNLAYSTADGDNAQRNASTSGLNIPVGATFQITWSSLYPTGSGSARQIGIGDVSISAGTSVFPPTIANLNVPLATVGSSSAPAVAEVTGDGGEPVTASGFVFASTSVDSTPEIGEVGVTQVSESAPGLGPVSETLTGLSPLTGYTVRAYAINAVGTRYTVALSFTTLGIPPTLVNTYSQAFDNYNGTNPAGWSTISDAVPPVQAYVGTWGTQTSTGGFLGGVSSPGVLGYRHTGNTGNLTVTLRLINATGAPLTSLNVSYLGRVNDTEEGRSPEWAVAINGVTPVVAESLNYSTLGNVDATIAKTVTVNILAGAEFTITWISSRGAGSLSSKQIGIGNVLITSTNPPVGGYASWNGANAGGQTADLDFDGDGLDNGVEYFMGTAGNAFSASPAVVSGVVTYPRSAGAVVNSFKVEVSSNLTTWENATVNYSANLSVTSNQVSFTLPTGPTKLFVRLSVEP